MSDNLYGMRKVTSRQIQRETKYIRSLLNTGETLAWVKGNKIVGYLSPAAQQSRPEPWPDLEARLRSIYGASPNESAPAASEVYDSRD